MKLKSLRPGDTIQFVTPASAINAERVAKAAMWFEEEGFRTKFAPHIFDDTGMFGGNDANRAEDFQSAFDDEETAAVFCTRGGYGCARLLPYLDLDRIVSSRKMLLGFSDVTVFHGALNRRGMPTVHAPMALTLHWDRADWVYESLRRVLKNDLTIPEGAPRGTTVVGGVAEGKAVGGCLCLLTDSIGTPIQFETAGNLVFIEDVDEQPHRIDAMLTHFLHSGLAEQAAGFVIGEMTRTDDLGAADIGVRPWREIVAERLAPLGKPMVVDFPFGHAKGMLTLPFGIRARLDADGGQLSYLEPLCS